MRGHIDYHAVPESFVQHDGDFVLVSATKSEMVSIETHRKRRNGKGVTASGPALSVASLRLLGSCGPGRRGCYWKATSEKLRSLRECKRSQSWTLSFSSAFNPISRCCPTRWR